MSTLIFVTSTITNPTYSYVVPIGDTFSTGLNVLNLNTFSSNTYGGTFTVTSTTSASGLFTVDSPPIDGTSNYELSLIISFNNGSVITPSTDIGTVGEIILGNTNFAFVSPSVDFNADLTNHSPFTEAGLVLGSLLDFTLACLHGSSLIETIDGQKRIDNIKTGDKVLSGPNLDRYASVKSLAHCWLSHMGNDHDAIIFEKGSLGENEPSERLIIDPGHPMCTKEEYLENGYEALKPAGSYWEERVGNKISANKWTDDIVQLESSKRYDIILEEPFNTFVANGVVVRAKGYKNNTYKHFV